MRASERKVKCYISQNIHLVLAIVMEMVQQKGIQIPALKPGFHMIAPIARVAPIARNSVQTIQAIIWKQ